MKISTEGIIKVLPFDPTFREHLLLAIPMLSPDKKSEVEQVLWDTYFAIYKMKFDENMQAELAASVKGAEPFDESIYERVTIKTEKDMMDELVNETIALDLEAAKVKLEVVMNNSETTK